MEGYTKFFIWAVMFIAAAVCTGHGPKLTMALAKLAAHAHIYDQMSYSKFNKELWGAHARPDRGSVRSHHKLSSL
jgi:hypothetical protein